MTGEAPCERCGTRIETDAAACPACGYEPSSLRRVTVLAAIAVPALLASALLLLATTVPSLVALDLAIPSSAATTLGVPTAVVSATVLWAYTRQDRRRPTDSTVF